MLRSCRVVKHDRHTGDRVEWKGKFDGTTSHGKNKRLPSAASSSEQKSVGAPYVTGPAAAPLLRRLQSFFPKAGRASLSHLAADLYLDASVGDHPSAGAGGQQLPASLDFGNQPHLVNGGDAVAAVQHETGEEWQPQQCTHCILADSRRTTQGQLECLPPCITGMKTLPQV